MPRQASQKPETTYRTAKPKDAVYRLSDGQGLYMQISPDGEKRWRFQYTRPAGGRNTLGFGDYPAVALATARERRDEARRLLAEGIDPGEHRKITKAMQKSRAANSFEFVALEWYAKFSVNWVDAHGERIIRRLERDVFPWLGGRPIAEITAPELLAVLRRIEDRGALETAHRALQNCGQVFRYGIATGRAERDPSQDLRGALPPPRKTHLAAITEPHAIGPLLRAMDAYTGTFVTKCALRLAPLVFVRPGELRQAEWAEIDLDAATWEIPADRMKMKQAHVVPLSTQAVEILRQLHALTGGRRYVFPSARTYDRPMSNNAILAALRRMGFDKEEMSGHGFRAMARTVLDEVLGFRPDFIEHQLAHAVRDPNGRAYNRTAHLPQRRKMMQAWADYLDTLKAENVVPFKARAA
jgi:integrase